jgi:hypothetical protein
LLLRPRSEFWIPITHPGYATNDCLDYYINQDSDSPSDPRTPVLLYSHTFSRDADPSPKSRRNSSQQHYSFTAHIMASSASPIDIATPRASPPNQTSNLTSQLQAANARSGDTQPPTFMANMERRGSEFRPDSLRPGSISMGNSFHSRPISMRDRGRRDSTNHAGSLMAGMSWGGLSVGSFIRDE